MSKQSKRELVGERITIYQRGKNEIYTACYHFKGKHQRVSLKTKNKKIARKRAVQLERRLFFAEEKVSYEQPVEVPIKTTSIQEAVKDFLADKETDRLAPKTLTKYSGILKCFGDYSQKTAVHLLDQIAMQLFDGYRSHRSKSLGEKSMHHEAVLMKDFFAWCSQRKLISENILASRRFPRPKQRRRERTLALENLQDLVCNAPGNIRIPLAVIALTGMRSGECQRLRREDIDLENGWITIRNRPGEETKTRETWRVPIHPQLQKLLENHQPTPKRYYFTEPPSRKYPQGGNKLNMKRFNERFKKLLERHGLPAGRKGGGFSVHDLRHAFKSIGVANGIPREYVDCWQGHTGIHTASDVYFHTFDETSQKYIRKIPFTCPCDG